MADQGNNPGNNQDTVRVGRPRIQNREQRDGAIRDLVGYIKRNGFTSDEIELLKIGAYILGKIGGLISNDDDEESDTED